MTKHAYKKTGYFAGIIGRCEEWLWQDKVEYVSLNYDLLHESTIAHIDDIVYCSNSRNGWITEPCKTCGYQGTHICDDCVDCANWLRKSEEVDVNAESI
jgi:hypothetical protein